MRYLHCLLLLFAASGFTFGDSFTFSGNLTSISSSGVSLLPSVTSGQSYSVTFNIDPNQLSQEIQSTNETDFYYSTPTTLTVGSDTYTFPETSLAVSTNCINGDCGHYVLVGNASDLLLGNVGFGFTNPSAQIVVELDLSNPIALTVPSSLPDLSSFTSTSLKIGGQAAAVNELDANAYYSLDGNVVSESQTPAPTPEPSTLLLLATGFAGAGRTTYRKLVARTFC